MLTLHLHNLPRHINYLQEFVDTLPTKIEQVLGTNYFWNINIAFVSAEEIHEKNKHYRQKDAPTDILTFPYTDDPTTTTSDDEVGDILICLQILEEKHKETYPEEADRLHMIIVHGLVHILGYDHETEADFETMNAIEEQILKA